VFRRAFTQHEHGRVARTREEKAGMLIEEMQIIERDETHRALVEEGARLRRFLVKQLAMDAF
jgi:3-methyladenine DNA glycosylase Tag